MKRFVVISTYPQHGSKNIGDQLITDSLVNLIKKYSDAQIDVVWRGAAWSEVQTMMDKADHVFFACLAIRKNIKKVYPFLDELLRLNPPITVVSAGTDLPVGAKALKVGGALSANDIEILKDLAEKCEYFTTRGALTQNYCEEIGIDSAELSGDVAFYSDDQTLDRKISFQSIRNIAISDPHKPQLYLSSFAALVRQVQDIFPESKITVVQHGTNETIDTFCREKGISSFKAYEDKHSGLDVYDKIDMHVGFRVHGHVSALKRGKLSYLLEQDGRGCDYGLTINEKLSVPNYLAIQYPSNFVALAKFVGKLAIGRSPFQYYASENSAYQLASMIRKDQSDGFSKFSGLADEIEQYQSSCERVVCKAVGETT